MFGCNAAIAERKGRKPAGAEAVRLKLANVDRGGRPSARNQLAVRSAFHPDRDLAADCQASQDQTSRKRPRN